MKWKKKSLQSFNVNGCLMIILLCGLITIRCPVATRMLSDIADGLCNWRGAKQCNYLLPEVSSLSGPQTRLHGKLLEDLHLSLPSEEVVLPRPLAVLLLHAFLHFHSPLVH